MLDCRDSSVETVRGIIFGEHQYLPCSRFEGFVPPSVTQLLSLKKVVAAVVLNCEAPMTVAQVSSRGRGIIRSKCDLQVWLWKVRIQHGQPQH